MKLFKKVLIANRGEIALRVLRSCKELGIETVAVHSKADEDSLHVKLADESVCIGPAKSSESYLNIASILSAAEVTGADAIHPGYGFLSENYEFSQMTQKWGVAFIGPNIDCLKKMGDKIESKMIARNADVPTLEPIYVQELSDKEILAAASKMGLPLLIKASSGGGGRGMKKINSFDDILSSIKVLKQESMAAFGDDTLFIEKYIEDPRHIEVQILADRHGNIVHVGERDCTVQRRFQKIVEESPSPVLTDKLREEICEAAVRLSRHVNYDSVGTVEFLFDQADQKFYFMEMNTRIQVEHPVTEERSGIDLISEQIKVAANNKLNFTQKDIKLSGHVIECRINAEHSETGMPSPGLISHYHRPGGIGVRVDDFVYSGYRVNPFYDSMISKVIVKGSTREICIARTKRALTEMVIEGISTNIEQHLKILNNANFTSNRFNTNFLVENKI